MNKPLNYRQNTRVVDQNSTFSVIQTNHVLRNIYLLLSLTLLFSALTAGWSMMVAAPLINPIITLVVYFVLLFAMQATRNSPMALF